MPHITVLSMFVDANFITHKILMRNTFFLTLKHFHHRIICVKTTFFLDNPFVPAPLVFSG